MTRFHLIEFFSCVTWVLYSCIHFSHNLSKYKQMFARAPEPDLFTPITKHYEMMNCEDPQCPKPTKSTPYQPGGAVGGWLSYKMHPNVMQNVAGLNKQHFEYGSLVGQGLQGAFDHWARQTIQKTWGQQQEEARLEKQDKCEHNHEKIHLFADNSVRCMLCGRQWDYIKDYQREALGKQHSDRVKMEILAAVDKAIRTPKLFDKELITGLAAPRKCGVECEHGCVCQFIEASDRGLLNRTQE